MKADDHELIESFMKLEVLLHRGMMLRHKSCFSNPHRGQGRVISILKLKPEITQRELTYLLGMSKQALGELLGKLEGCGYIVRSAAPWDGRMMVVKLTEKGQEAADGMAAAEEASENIFSTLTEEEKENLKVYLGKIIDQGKKLCSCEEGDRKARREPAAGAVQEWPFG